MNINVPKWLALAETLKGVYEGAGDVDNPAVVKMFADCGHPEVVHDSTPWCAAFVGACLERSKIRSTRSLWALDYRNWAEDLGYPALGAIAVKRRSNKAGKLIGGHVFFVVGWDDNYVWGLGGNQSDKVCVVRFARAGILTYRWPLKDKPTRVSVLGVNTVYPDSNKEE